MNIIDIVILVILAFGLLSGMHKGLLASILATAGIAAAWFLADHFYVQVAQYALGNETFMAVLREYLEPETLFASVQLAGTPVSQIVAGGPEALAGLGNSLAAGVGFIKDAFLNNVSLQAFQDLSITTAAEYLDQTIWQAAFNVISFLGCFVVFYIAALLIVNLLNHVVRFPVLRLFDGLLGGVLGVARAVVVVLILVAVVPMITSIFLPEMTAQLLDSSKLIAFLESFKLPVGDYIHQLMGL